MACPTAFNPIFLSFASRSLIANSSLVGETAALPNSLNETRRLLIAANASRIRLQTKIVLVAFAQRAGVEGRIRVA